MGFDGLRSGGLFTEHTLNGSRGNGVVPGDRADALPVDAFQTDRFPIKAERSAADVPAFKAGAPHAGADPLDDQAALQFGDHADDGDNSAAQRTAGIDIFPEGEELDLQPVQFIEHFEEVLHRPGDPVAGPDQNDIEPAAAGIAQQLVETRTFGLGAGDPVGVFLDDLEAALGSQLTQIVQLRAYSSDVGT